MRRVVGLFRERFVAPEGALSLAALRLVVPLLLVVAPEFRNGASVAAWDEARFVVPEGLEWFVRHVPISAALARTAQAVGIASALLAMSGLRARLSLGVLAVSCCYIYAVSSLAGHVWKNLHLLWFCALLAASPCDEVLAVGARASPFSAGRRYGAPLFFVAALFAVIYFFPGVHKLARSGLAWAFSDNLENQLRWKWLQHGAVPALRLDLHPRWLHAGGFLVVSFELLAPVLFLRRRLRPWALALGLGFHLFAGFVFDLVFASLWLCYVALVDWRPLARLIAPHLGGMPVDPLPAPRHEVPRGTLVVGSLLLAAAIVQGARGRTQSFPFACYPTFEWRAADRMPDLVIAAVAADGRELEVAHAQSADGRRTQRQWAELFSLAGVTAAVSRERLEAYYRVEVERTLERDAPDARSVRFYRVERSVLPEARGRPLSRRLLLELAR